MCVCVCACVGLSVCLSVFVEELPVGTDPSDTEKADMRLVQAAGHEV